MLIPAQRYSLAQATLWRETCTGSVLYFDRSHPVSDVFTVAQVASRSYLRHVALQPSVLEITLGLMTITSQATNWLTLNVHVFLQKVYFIY